MKKIYLLIMEKNYLLRIKHKSNCVMPEMVVLNDIIKY